MAVDFELGLSSSRLEGLALAGAPGLSVSLPISLSVAGVGLEDVELSVAAAADGALSLAAGLTVTVNLGVLQAEIEGLGLRLDLAPAPSAPGNLGPLRPPWPSRRRLASRRGRGGRRQRRRLISRRRPLRRRAQPRRRRRRRRRLRGRRHQPAGRPGRVRLVRQPSLRFPGIPLGFGFSLTGSGGCWPSTAPSTPRRSRWACATAPPTRVLFPENPLRDAELLVAQLDEYFPILAGNTVIGPVVEISWGVPDVHHRPARRGHLPAPGRDRGARLGGGGAARPRRAGAGAAPRHARRGRPAAADAAGRRVAVRLAAARLHRAVGRRRPLRQLGSRTRTSCCRSAGSTPASSRPAHVPRRVRGRCGRCGPTWTWASASPPSIRPTSRSPRTRVQFGGGFELAASADFLGVTYTARGWFDFDVLLQFSPFLLIADASAGVGVFASDRELMGVELDAAPRGSGPLVRERRGLLQVLRRQGALRRDGRGPRRAGDARHRRRARAGPAGAGRPRRVDHRAGGGPGGRAWCCAGDGPAGVRCGRTTGRGPPARRAARADAGALRQLTPQQDEVERRVDAGARRRQRRSRWPGSTSRTRW